MDMSAIAVVVAVASKEWLIRVLLKGWGAITNVATIPVLRVVRTAKGNVRVSLVHVLRAWSVFHIENDAVLTKVHAASRQL